MNQITEAPLRYDAGLDFNYASWTPGSQLTLVNVPWNNDYRDIVKFPNRTALNDWIDTNAGPTITRMTLMKFGSPIKIEMGINTAMQYNYCRVSNPGMYGDTKRDLYYFILEAQYLNAGVTVLTLQLDVIQTFGYDVTFGNCYIERGHLGIANSKAFDHYGRDYLTVPEGLDIGGEYRIVHTEHERILDPSGDADVDPGYDVLVCSTLDLTQDPGTLANPAIDSAPGSAFQGLPSGAMFYLFKTGYDLRTFFLKYKDKPWITQSIISITLIPNMKRYVPGYSYGDNLSTDGDFEFYAAGSDVPAPHTRKVLPGWREKDFIGNILGTEYGILKKFLTYPYLVIEMTTYTGSATILKPESWQDADAKVVELAAFTPPGQRIVVYPSRYNADEETLSGTETDHQDVNLYRDDLGEFINTAVTLDNFPSLPVVNNMAMAYLAQNKHGLAWQQRSADWSQQRALASANTGANQAMVGVQNSQELTNIQTSTNAAQASLQANTIATGAILNGVGDLAGGAVHGGMAGPVGMGVGAAGGALQAGVGLGQAANQSHQTLQAANIANNAARSSNASNVGQMMYARDSNLALAQFAAQGDYANAIGGINAKIQDAALTQPSMSGQFGGDAFNLVNNIFGYTLKWKMPSLNALRQIGDIWLRYGYSIHQYGTIPASWMVMSKFTYWKLSETYILTAPIPESFKQIIRGIFEKGVTVWANPDDIGRTALSENTPLQNVSY